MLLASLLVTAGALYAYDRWQVQPALKLAVVDVGEVYRSKEAEFTRLLTHASSDEERQQALEVARHFAQRLPQALDELGRECGCLVMIRSAVVAPSPRTVDLTGRLQAMLERP
ncbi:hypothetical protein [Sphaerotilus microaerophilus]|uniref:Type-F conjugative transfer system protein TrbI n=1 Tax=Sphaerotilus microaerophilus TaxID=2914710 RepID=A0ABN6PQD2_9BURK|nr:hypothetical protein [Sphaerotilus sp. FB-5]BDI06085.1 hypothetical protein CATMQ487_30550 [Sphaerotilus sp. FB-5]